MSLINEALKRAKQAQRPGQPSSPSLLQFRPVEAAQRRSRRYDWIVPAAVALVGIFAFVAFWPWARNRAASRTAETSGQSVVAAKELSSAAAPVQPNPAPPPPAPPAPVVASNSATASQAVAPAETNALASSEPPAPKLPPLRLQAIVYNPTRPSAMIGGRTLYLGDKLGGLRLVAIDQESATLVGLGQTNVLMLDQ